MKRFAFFMILLLVFAGFGLTACDENEPTNPEDANWAVIITKSDQAKDDVYDVMVSWVNETDPIDMPESMELEVAGEPVALENWESFWFGSVNLLAGQQYNVKLAIDGEEQVDTQIKIVYPVTGTFPEFYNPTMSSTLSWSMFADNEDQVASLSSINMNNYEQQDEYLAENLSASDRSFTFPAAAVDDFGTTTMFTMEITQMNVKTVNDVMVMSGHSDAQDYGYGSKGERNPIQKFNHYRKLLELYR